jgi:hypothetical protein
MFEYTPLPVWAAAQPWVLQVRRSVPGTGDSLSGSSPLSVVGTEERPSAEALSNRLVAKVTLPLLPPHLAGGPRCIVYILIMVMMFRGTHGAHAAGQIPLATDTKPCHQDFRASNRICRQHAATSVPLSAA